VNDPAAASPRSGLRSALLAAILAAAAFGLLWGLRQPARPLPPTADLYTHLSVARHLERGEGYLTDITYPLSFAYPFARRLPQPLLHRMPGYGTVLTVPWLMSGRDPAGALDAVRVMQIILVIGAVGFGAFALWRRGSGEAIPFWMILLGTSPLLSFSVAWGQDEVLVSCLLLVIWLHLRRATSPRPILVGILTGLLALVRLELCWVPVLWWLLLTRPSGPGIRRLRVDRSFGWMVAVAVAVLIPWSLRNLALTGQPFFTLQGAAEHAKDTRTFPGYGIYRNLEPQPLIPFAVHHTDSLLRKTARGVRFYGEDMPRFLAWPWLLVLVAAPLGAIWRRARGVPRYGASARGLGLATGTLVLLALFYSPFDHSLRHLLPMYPLLTWDLAAYAAGSDRPRGARPALVRAGILAGAAVVAAMVFPCRLPGWETAARDAVRLQPAVQQEAFRLREMGPGIAFTEYSAAPWLADRPAVWTPADETVRERIVDLLTPDAERRQP